MDFARATTQLQYTQDEEGVFRHSCKDPLLVCLHEDDNVIEYQVLCWRCQQYWPAINMPAEDHSPSDETVIGVAVQDSLHPDLRTCCYVCGKQHKRLRHHNGKKICARCLRSAPLFTGVYA